MIHPRKERIKNLKLPEVSLSIPLTKIKHFFMNGCDCVVQLLQLQFHHLAQVGYNTINTQY